MILEAATTYDPFLDGHAPHGPGQNFKGSRSNSSAISQLECTCGMPIRCTSRHRWASNRSVSSAPNHRGHVAIAANGNVPATVHGHDK
jgi:hypothetical protein